MFRFRVVLVIAFLFIVPVAVFSQAKWKRVSSFRFNWDGQEGVQVALEIPSTWSHPGDFTRIRIRVPGQKDFSLNNNDGWVKYDSAEASRPTKKVATKNVVPSNHVLVLKVAENRVALFLFGYVYASSPGSLDVLELSADGHPQVVFHRDEFGLTDFRDFDGDGVAEVVGYPCLSQEFGNGLLTYDPFNVYKLGKTPATSARLSLPLSKSYNLRHYYGWAGAQCREDIAVVVHPPMGGKPMVMSTQEAERLTSPKH